MPTTSACPSLDWVPTGPLPPPGTVLVPAGVHWDAVRVPWALARYAALRLITITGDHRSAILSAPLHDEDVEGSPGYLNRALYWFIPPGTGTAWMVPGVRVLSTGDHLAIPPATATGAADPRVPHWHRPPVPGAWQALPQALLGALQAAAWDRAYRSGGGYR